MTFVKLIRKIVRLMINLDEISKNKSNDKK